MSDEIEYINANDTGLTLTARISQKGTQIGALVNMTESGTLPGHYFADFPPSNPEGTYTIEIFDGSLLKGDAFALYWSGTFEIDLYQIYLLLTNGSLDDILELILDHSRAANLQTQKEN